MPNRPTWSPGTKDFSQALRDQNPWFVGGQVPLALAHQTERPLAGMLWRRLLHDQPRRFQFILGPRRVGKTTSLYQTVRHLRETLPANRLWWLRLDHPLLMQISLGDLVRSTMAAVNASLDNPVFLFLDELSYARDWDLWLKTFYDEQWPVRIAASSSATAALRNRTLESGVGRWEEQYLGPYLFPEYLELIKRGVDVTPQDSLASTIAHALAATPLSTELSHQRRRFILVGGFPELLSTVDAASDDATALLNSQRTLRSDAVERAIYKDIPQAFGAVDAMMLERLLYTLAGQVTGLVSPAKISSTVGTTQPTIDRYLSYLERAFLIFMLPNYAGNEDARQRRGRKVYFVDGAIRNAALQRGLAPLHDQAEMGLLLENLAAAHLHALSQQTQTRLYHWRDKNSEVDLVYDHPDQPLAFEIGSSPDHHRRGLRNFAERFPRFARACFLVSPGIEPVSPARSADGIGSIPLDLFLVLVGAQAKHALTARLR